LVEVSEPVSIEGIEAGVALDVHLFVGLVEEVVQLVAASVVAASFAWALLVAGECNWIEIVFSGLAAISWDQWVAAASNGEESVILECDSQVYFSNWAAFHGVWNWIQVLNLAAVIVGQALVTSGGWAPFVSLVLAAVLLGLADTVAHDFVIAALLAGVITALLKTFWATAISVGLVFEWSGTALLLANAISVLVLADDFTNGAAWGHAGTLAIANVFVATAVVALNWIFVWAVHPWEAWVGVVGLFARLDCASLGDWVVGVALGYEWADVFAALVGVSVGGNTVFETVDFVFTSAMVLWGVLDTLVVTLEGGQVTAVFLGNTFVLVFAPLVGVFVTALWVDLWDLLGDALVSLTNSHTIASMGVWVGVAAILLGLAFISDCAEGGWLVTANLIAVLCAVCVNADLVFSLGAASVSLGDTFAVAPLLGVISDTAGLFCGNTLSCLFAPPFGIETTVFITADTYFY
jgi:hypothetical protein